MEVDGARWCWVCLHPIETNDLDVIVAFQTIDRVQRAITMHRRCNSSDVVGALKLEPEPDLVYAPRLGPRPSSSHRR